MGLIRIREKKREVLPTQNSERGGGRGKKENNRTGVAGHGKGNRMRVAT